MFIMRHFLIFLTLIAASLPALSQTSVYSCDFETWTGNVPDCMVGTKTSLEADSIQPFLTNASYGMWACQLINRESGHRRLTTHPVTVYSGITYTIGFWVKGHGNIRTGLYDSRVSGSGYAPYNAYIQVNSNTFTYQTQTITAAKDFSAAEFILSVQYTNPDKGHIIVDDLEITGPGIFTPGTITYGTNLTNALTSGATVHQYTFTGTAGEVILAKMTVQNGSFDPEMQILMPGDSVIRFVTANGSMAVLDTVHLPVSGTYKLVATSSSGNATGGYSLSLHKVSTPGSGAPLPANTNHWDTLGYVGYMNAYQLDVTANDVFTIQLKSSYAAFTPELRIYAPDGTMECIAGVPWDFSLLKLDTIRLSQSGLYTIITTSADNGWGEYCFNIQKISPTVLTELIPPNVNKWDTLTGYFHMNAYQLDVSANDVFTIQMKSSYAAFTPELRIYAPDGTMECIAGVPWDYSLLKLDTLRLSQSGLYTIITTSADNGWGEYCFNIQKISPTILTELIPPNVNKWDTLTGYFHMNAYQLDVMANDVFTIQMKSSYAAFTPELRIYAPDGTMECIAGVPWDFSLLKLDTIRVSQSGLYTIITTSADNGWGEYCFNIQKISPTILTELIPPNVNKWDTLAGYFHMNAYQLDVAANDVFTIQMKSSYAAFTPELRIYAPDGTMECIAGVPWDFSLLKLDTIRLSQSGLYTIITTSADNGWGEYCFNIQKISPTILTELIPPNVNKWDTLTGYFHMNTYQLDVSANDVFTIQMKSWNAAFTPELRIYAPDGTMECIAGVPWDFSLLKLDTIRLSQSGLYTIITTSADNGWGQYGFSLQRVSSPGSPDLIDPNTSINGNISKVAFSSAISFAAHKYDIYTISVSAVNQAFDPWIRFFDPDGLMIASGSSGQSQVDIPNITTTKTGIYTIWVAAEGGTETGAFNLSLTRNFAAPILCGLDDHVCHGTEAMFQICNLSPGQSLSFYKDGNLLSTSLISIAGKQVLSSGFLTQDAVFGITVSGADQTVYLDTSIQVTVVPGASVNGIVSYDNATASPLGGTMVHLYLNGALQDSCMTDRLGRYRFCGLTSQAYEVKPVSCGITHGGVNSIDALLIMQHFVGLTTLTGLRLTAADLNLSGSVNSVDALMAQKRFVGLLGSFPLNDWLFEEAVVTPSVNQPETLNLKGLCAGDVNASYQP